ncbi:MAG: hypothetical protein ABJB55_02620 [Actinomycetota bacterium]
MRLERWISPAGRTRWLTILDPGEEATYAAATRLALARPLVGPRSFGHPLGSRPWPSARRAWSRTIRAAVTPGALVVVNDVASCYPSIGERALRIAVRNAGGFLDPVLAALHRCHGLGIDGLPIGPAPSAHLAEAVLAIADDRARAAGLAPIRWVDDVVFAGDRGAVLRAERAWLEALGDLGLHGNDAKRRSFVSDGGDILALIGGTSVPGGDRRGIIRTS